MHNDVVEHIFYVWGNCVRKRREGYTLLYHTRARKGEKGKSKKMPVREKSVVQRLTNSTHLFKLRSIPPFFRLQSAERKCSRIVYILA